MMTAAVVSNNHTISVPSFQNGESVIVMNNGELERQINNAVYLAKLEYSMKYGKLVEHELIEDEDEDTVV